MGSSGWMYSAPFQKDIIALFSELQEKVFYERNYYNPFMDEENPPSSIMDLLMECQECGTHSLLDIGCVSQTRDFATASPMTREEMIQFFGSDTPSLQTIKENSQKVMDTLDRWYCLFCTAYEDNSPVETVFIGVSGN